MNRGSKKTTSRGGTGSLKMGSMASHNAVHAGVINSLLVIASKENLNLKIINKTK